MPTDPGRQAYVEAEMAKRVRQLAMESDRQRYVEAETANRVRHRYQHYGSFMAATVIIGPVAVVLMVVQLIMGKPIALGEVAYFLAIWAVVFVVAHSRIWVYFTWHRGRHSRR